MPRRIRGVRDSRIKFWREGFKKIAEETHQTKDSSEKLRLGTQLRLGTRLGTQHGLYNESSVEELVGSIGQTKIKDRNGSGI